MIFNFKSILKICCLLVISGLILSNCSGCGEPVSTKRYEPLGAGFLSDTTVWLLGLSFLEYSNNESLQSSSTWYEDVTLELIQFDIYTLSIKRIQTISFDHSIKKITSADYGVRDYSLLAVSNGEKVVVRPSANIDTSGYLLDFNTEKRVVLKNITLGTSLYGMSDLGNWCLHGQKITNIIDGSSKTIDLENFIPFYMDESTMDVYGTVDTLLIKHSIKTAHSDTIRPISGTSFPFDIGPYGVRSCYSGEIMVLDKRFPVRVEKLNDFLENDSSGIITEFSNKRNILDLNSSNKQFLTLVSNGIRITNYNSGDEEVLLRN